MTIHYGYCLFIILFHPTWFPEASEIDTNTVAFLGKLVEGAESWAEHIRIASWLLKAEWLREWPEMPSCLNLRFTRQVHSLIS